MRTGKQSDMFRMPKAAEPLISGFSVAFTRPTFNRFVVLMLGAIVSLRYRTVTGMLRAIGPLAVGHWSDFHRVLCRRVWSMQPLAKVLARLIVDLIPPHQPVVCAVDDTNPQHKGKRVYGKGRHHDACRSTHSHTVWVWGHKWVVLAIQVQFPFAPRPWALPVLCALYRPEELNASEGRRHKTPIDLARQLMAVLIHWFPDRPFILVGDGGYASHDLARFCHRHRQHVTLISRFNPQAHLCAAPPVQRSSVGRPRCRGRKLATPKAVVAKARRRRYTVNWYGGRTRRVELVDGVGHWYRSGQGLVPLKWIFVHDVEGTHRDEYFYCTDSTLRPDQIVSLFTTRWGIEVTFQEVRTHLGFHTPRNWSAKSVLRTAPCLLGLFSVVCLMFERWTRQSRPVIKSNPWYQKKEITFSDAITAVRRLCWQEIFKHPPFATGVDKLPRLFRFTLLDYLSRAT